MSDVSVGTLDGVKMRALFLADGLRDYIWALSTAAERSPFMDSMRLVVGDKCERLLASIASATATVSVASEKEL